MAPIYFPDNMSISISFRDIAAILFVMSALIALIITAVIIVSFHYFFMKTVDGYTSYGQGGTFREWQEFEREKMQLR